LTTSSCRVLEKRLVIEADGYTIVLVDQFAAEIGRHIEVGGRA
jgi:hypothetical protein